VPAAAAAACAAAAQEFCRQDEQPGNWVEVALIGVRHGLCMGGQDARAIWMVLGQPVGVGLRERPVREVIGHRPIVDVRRLGESPRMS
jgi:hypothetical protein